MRGHDVGVTLDDDCPVLPGDLALGQVDAVEQLAFLVDRRLGCVEVLRVDRVVVEQSPSAEPDDVAGQVADRPQQARSEEHTSELQSHVNLVCRLLLEKKKKKTYNHYDNTLTTH